VSQPELLKLVGQRLEAAGIEYMVSGAIASSLQGEPRATHEGDNVDFWLLTDDSFDRARFDRRYVELFEGTRVPFSRPEDTILMKPRWAAMLGGSEKQFTDALRVYEVQHGRLDESYLDRWAATLDVRDAMTRLRAEARPVE
jgi:hypothetical protein